MKQLSSLTAFLVLAGIASAQPSNEFLRTNPKFVQTFRPVIEKSAASVVRVQCDGKDTCFGVVTTSDGCILTKAHDLDSKIVCQTKDGRQFEAKLIGVHPV